MRCLVWRLPFPTMFVGVVGYPHNQFRHKLLIKRFINNKIENIFTVLNLCKEVGTSKDKTPSGFGYWIGEHNLATCVHIWVHWSVIVCCKISWFLAIAYAREKKSNASSMFLMRTTDCMYNLKLLIHPYRDSQSVCYFSKILENEWMIYISVGCAMCIRCHEKKTKNNPAHE